ncbi:MAG: 50S ribosomal protein L6 [Lactobacillaceae bacterium]|jgi:large subunit ribosomal protein L6|nr:50S ribosomal protein L6 [Lactobacillaceae bacterium]
MSRIGKYPVVIPAGVNVEIKGNVVTAKGKLGELSYSFDPNLTTVKQEENKIVVTPVSENKRGRTLWGTVKARINNLVIGVNEGFKKELELLGVGYKSRMQGSDLILSLGFSHDVVFSAPQGVTITCPTQTQISVFGADKDLVGQTAAEIREYRKPEPYKGKGVRYVGEYVRRKEGKKK